MNLIDLISPIVFKKRLTEITYFTTSACNFRCRHCFMVNHLNEQLDDLSVSEIEKMGHHIRSLQRVHLGGGEPFLKDNIAEKALIVANQWNSRVLCIPTNGWFTSNIINSIEKFGEGSNKTFRIHFSINKIGKEMDSFSGREGAFDRWNVSIIKALNLSKKYKNISIVGLVTFGDYNQNDFVELKKYLLEGVGVDDFSFQLCRKHDGYSNESDIDRFDAYVTEYFQNECNQNPFLAAYRELVRKYSANYSREKKQITPCYAGRTRVVMSPNGDIYPCETKGYPNGNCQNKWIMGNVRNFDYNLTKLLQSKTAREVVSRIATDKCHCEHGIDLSLNLLCSNMFKMKVVILGMKNFIFRYV
jgi:radical SAM protein with 4Fe4S-binding SPASM domain